MTDLISITDGSKLPPVNLHKLSTQKSCANCISLQNPQIDPPPFLFFNNYCCEREDGPKYNQLIQAQKSICDWWAGEYTL